LITEGLRDTLGADVEQLKSVILRVQAGDHAAYEIVVLYLNPTPQAPDRTP
jgi:hypothetical protein